MVMRECYAAKRYVLAHDGRRLIREQLPIIADWNQPECIGDWEAVPRATLVRCCSRAGTVNQPLNLQRKLVAQGDGVDHRPRFIVDGIGRHDVSSDNRSNEYAWEGCNEAIPRIQSETSRL